MTDFLIRYEIYNFFQTISDSFRPTPVEMVFIVLGIALFAGLFVFFYRYQKKKSLSKAREAATAYFEKLIKPAKLNDQEKALLDKIAHRYYGGELKRYAVVQRAGAFDEAFGALIADGEVERKEGEAVRQKLTETTFSETFSAATTRNLPAGIRVYLLDKERKPLGYGNLALKLPDRLEIELTQTAGPLQQGDEIAVFLKRNTETFVFYPRIIEIGPGLVTVSHPEKIKKVQRRNYFRKESRLRGHIKKSDGSKRTVTTVTDLGGGGASVYNRTGAFDKGDGVILSLKLPESAIMELNGTVVRTSQNNEKLHIKFGPMPDRDRDRIIAHTLRK